MKKILLIVAMMFVNFSAMADMSGWLDINLASKHSESSYIQNGVRKDYNEKNLGFGLSFSLHDNIDGKFGFYENSYDATSLYGAFDFHTSYKQTFAAGIDIGIVTGYDVMYPSSHFLLYGMPHVTAIWNDMRIQLGYVPAVFKRNEVSIATLRVGYRF